MKGGGNGTGIECATYRMKYWGLRFAVLNDSMELRVPAAGDLNAGFGTPFKRIRIWRHERQVARQALAAIRRALNIIPGVHQH